MYTRIGHVLVDPSCASLSEFIEVPRVFVVEDGTGPDLLNLFSTQVTLSTSIIMSIIIYLLLSVKNRLMDPRLMHPMIVICVSV